MLSWYNLIATKILGKQVNYTTMRNRNQLVLPLNLEIRIDKNDPVRKLVEICDDLDYTKLYKLYLRSRRKVDPVILFEILVFANMNGIYSSREIEKPVKMILDLCGFCRTNRCRTIQPLRDFRMRNSQELLRNYSIRWLKNFTD